jgi:hypothetical protein
MANIVNRPDKIVVIAEAEIVLDAYNQGLQGLNGCLAIINESMHPLGFHVFDEIKTGMDHFGHAYTLLLDYLNTDDGDHE